MTNREAIEELKMLKRTVKEESDSDKAIDLAIFALEKQSVDKCCETCKYEHLELDAYPCCDCIRAKDYYEPYTEEES